MRIELPVPVLIYGVVLCASETNVKGRQALLGAALIPVSTSRRHELEGMRPYAARKGSHYSLERNVPVEAT